MPAALGICLLHQMKGTFRAEALEERAACSRWLASVASAAQVLVRPKAAPGAEGYTAKQQQPQIQVSPSQYLSPCTNTMQGPLCPFCQGKAQLHGRALQPARAPPVPGPTYWQVLSAKVAIEGADLMDGSTMSRSAAAIKRKFSWLMKTAWNRDVVRTETASPSTVLSSRRGTFFCHPAGIQSKGWSLLDRFRDSSRKKVESHFVGKTGGRCQTRDLPAVRLLFQCQ